MASRRPDRSRTRRSSSGRVLSDSVLSQKPRADRVLGESLAGRIARRRRKERQRQIRRRRFTALLVGVLVLGAAGFFLTRGGSDDSTNQTLASGSGSVPGNSTGDGSSSGVGGASGAQPDSSWKPYTGPVPIVMYHVIGDPAGDVAYPDLFLSVDDFQEQVDWLADNGYTAVTLDQVEDAWFNGKTLPEKPVVLSFDDGYLGQYTDAMPILREKGWGGLLNLKAEGSDLNTTEVKKMMDAGWEVASHTVRHLDLTTLDGPTLEDEVSGSKDMLEKELGVDVNNFCYPAGQYNDKVIKAVKSAGYVGATTENPGLADKSKPFELNRIRISQGDGADALSSLLDSA